MVAAETGVARRRSRKRIGVVTPKEFCRALWERRRVLASPSTPLGIQTLQLGIEYYPAPPFPERRPQDVAVEIQDRIRRFESEGGKKQLAQEPAFKDMFELSKGA